jgi:hypothetical protein
MAYITHKDVRFDWENYFKIRFEDQELSPIRPAEVDQRGFENSQPYPFTVEKCFVCGNALTVPYIFWSGLSEIAFHIPCASGFVNALRRDVWEHQVGRRGAEILYQEIKPSAERLKRIKENDDQKD